MLQQLQAGQVRAGSIYNVAPPPWFRSVGSAATLLERCHHRLDNEQKLIFTTICSERGEETVQTRKVVRARIIPA